MSGHRGANVGTFRSLISRMEGELLDQVVPEGGGLTRATMALANRWVTSQQLGFLLGFMGTRVLGQYDLAILSAEADDGRLLFVEENVRGTAHALGIPVSPFRTWIALHETTHAFEFEAHPWLRPYLAERLERQLSLFSGNASSLGRDTIRAIGRALRGESLEEDPGQVFVAQAHLGHELKDLGVALGHLGGNISDDRRSCGAPHDRRARGLRRRASR